MDPLISTSANQGGTQFNGQKYTTLTLAICIWTGLGLSLGLFLILPSNNDFEGARSAISLADTCIVFSAMILTTFMMARFIRNREKFHKDQVVFWPSRCRHCAEALYAPTYQKYSTEEISEIGSEENFNLRFGNSVSFSSCDHLRRESSISRRNQTPSEGSSRSESASVAAYPERSPVHTYHKERVYSQNAIHIQNRAVVNVFKVFCFVTLVGVLDGFIFTVVCFRQGDYSLFTKVKRSFIYINHLGFYSVLFLFIECYFNAVFVYTFQNLFTVSLLMAVSIWIASVRLSNYIFDMLEIGFRPETYINATTDCELTGIFGRVLLHMYEITDPFVTENALIVLGLSMQVWNSFVLKSSLYLQSDRANFRSSKTRGIVYSLRKIISKFQCCKTIEASWQDESGNEQLLASRKHDTRLVKLAWVISVFTNILLLAVSLFSIFACDELFPHNCDEYLRWCIEILIYVATCFLCAYQMHITSNSSPNSGGCELSMNGNEMVLLLASGGTFCHCFIRMLLLLFCQVAAIRTETTSICA